MSRSAPAERTADRTHSVHLGFNDAVPTEWPCLWARRGIQLGGSSRRQYRFRCCSRLSTGRRRLPPRIGRTLPGAFLFWSISARRAAGAKSSLDHRHITRRGVATGAEGRPKAGVERHERVDEPPHRVTAPSRRGRGSRLASGRLRVCTCSGDTCVAVSHCVRACAVACHGVARVGPCALAAVRGRGACHLTAEGEMPRRCAEHIAGGRA